MALLGLLPSNTGRRKRQAARPRAARACRSTSSTAVRGNRMAVIFQEPMTALNPVYTVGFQIIESLRPHFDHVAGRSQGARLSCSSLVEMPDPEKAFNSYPTSSRAVSGSAP